MPVHCYLTKTIDGARLVSGKDGWEAPDTTDILAIHDYAYDSLLFQKKYRPDNYDAVYPQSRKLIAQGCVYAGQPVLLTEFGGIAMRGDISDGNWGYNVSAETEEEFLLRYRNLMDGTYSFEQFQGFCYTQLTDVQQEVNGLLYPDRTPKFDMEKLKKITEHKE